MKQKNMLNKRDQTTYIKIYCCEFNFSANNINKMRLM